MVFYAQTFSPLCRSRKSIITCKVGIVAAGNPIMGKGLVHIMVDLFVAFRVDKAVLCTFDELLKRFIVYLNTVESVKSVSTSLLAVFKRWVSFRS